MRILCKNLHDHMLCIWHRHGEDLGLGEGDGGAAMKFGHVHGMAAARARW